VAYLVEPGRVGRGGSTKGRVVVADEVRMKSPACVHHAILVKEALNLVILPSPVDVAIGDEERFVERQLVAGLVDRIRRAQIMRRHEMDDDARVPPQEI